MDLALPVLLPARKCHSSTLARTGQGACGVGADGGYGNRKGPNMSRSILAGAAAIAAAAIVPQWPATAQDITVRAPITRSDEQPRLGVHPRMRLASTVRVETHDLDLRTAYGRAVLDARIRLAADAACDRLDDIEPPTGVGAAMNPDIGDCRHLAVKTAQFQVLSAIRADRG